ncbi:MAG: helix-turn-helix domain-containing protein [Rhodothermales bacterium]
MDELLTLKEASEQLGVHPVTLRRWSESGKIEVVRTPGGHRRFPASEVARLKRGPDRGTMSVTAAASAREDFQERALATTREDLKHVKADWAQSANQDELEEKRVLGRRLMGLLMQYVGVEGDDGDDILDEARVVARIYAKGIVSAGVPLAEALRATHFFKDHILESAVVLPETAGRRPEANQRMFRRLNGFLNEIQIVIAEAYRS